MTAILTGMACSVLDCAFLYGAIRNAAGVLMDGGLGAMFRYAASRQVLLMALVGVRFTAILAYVLVRNPRRLQWRRSSLFDD